MNILKRFRTFLDNVGEGAMALVAAIEDDDTAAGAGEPTWTLYAEDPLASGIVREWCSLAQLNRVNPEKVADALRIAEQMDHMTPGICFTLRGQDKLAGPALALWVSRARNRGGYNAAVIAAGEHTVAAMQAWTPNKLPD